VTGNRYTDNDWRERASELRDKGGVSERRSEAVALYELGLTYEEIVEVLGMSDRGNVGYHIRAYREEDRPQAEWLANNGPEI
jgi:hypothetical protein